MAAIARSQTSDCTNPTLDIYTTVGGVLTDIFSLEYQIFEKVSTPGVPVQVFPVAGRQAVDLAACPAGDKIATGHYVGAWTVPAAEPVGTHEIRWFFKLTALSPEQSWTEEFEVLNVSASAPAEYATVQQMRDEGVTVAQASDARLLLLIQRASMMIDRWTRRWFSPRSLVLKLDGSDSGMLLLQDPIISISEIRILSNTFLVDGSDAIDLDDLRVYNRHLTQHLQNPDDRDNPKIEWVSDTYWHRAVHGQRLPDVFSFGWWPAGTQNIQVTGIFGYTEWDGSATGKTPDMINLACRMLVVRELTPIANIEERSESRNSGRITSLRTRDQSISWGSQPSDTRGVGFFSGDPTIDGIIADFIRLPTLGAA